MRLQMDDPAICIQWLAAASTESWPEIGRFWLADDLVMDATCVSSWRFSFQMGALCLLFIPSPEWTGRLLAAES